MGFLYKGSDVSQIKTLNFKEIDGIWTIELLNGTVLRAKSLIWGLPPWKLLSLFGNKSELNNNFIEFCEKTRGSYGLKVLFKLKEKISEYEGDIFYSFKLTHEWATFWVTFMN